MIPLAYNVRSLTVRKASTIATVIGVGLVVAVFASTLMLVAGINKTLTTTGKPENALILRQGSDGELTSAIEEPQVGMLLAKPQVAHVQSTSGGSVGAGVGEVVIVIALDKLGTTGVSNVMVRGVPANVYEFRPEARIIEGRKAKPGTDEVVVGKGIHKRFAGVELGKSFDLKKNRPVTVVGVFETGGSSYESEVWADLDTARTAFGRQGLVSAVRVTLAGTSKFDAFKNDVESDKKLGLSVEREDKFYEKQSQGMAGFIGGLGGVMAFLFAIGAMIGASITMYGQVANRVKEIGTLRALGFSRFSILSSFLLESILLALTGGVFGALLSMLMQFVTFSQVSMTNWSEVVFRFEPTPGVVIGSLIFAGFMGVVGGFLPALRASAVSPIQAMRN